MLELRPIAHVRSPYAQKLGVPRQSGLAEQVRSSLHFDVDAVGAESVRGLDRASHLWLIWGFSEHFDAPRKDTVRPPRLGGQARMGVFATRSSFRPNPLGLSLVRLVSSDFPELVVEGADMLNGTPVYDIKPYLPWAESQPQATCAWAPAAPARLAVRFVDEALAQGLRPDQRVAIEASLAFDPRSPWERERVRSWSTRIADLEVEFAVRDDTVWIQRAEPAPDATP